MKIAIVGSRNISKFNIGDYLPDNVTEIVSGGARGVDSFARTFAEQNGIKLTEILPEYGRYGKAAPLFRNLRIIEYSDEVIAFWDGKSRGTKHVIDNCRKRNKKVTVYLCKTVT